MKINLKKESKEIMRAVRDSISLEGFMSLHNSELAWGFCE